MRTTDFDAMLRLKCIANNWGIPIIMFGTYYEQQSLQYAAIMVRDVRGNVRSMICILNCGELMDIHSRLCEVACNLIETIGSFPDYNYVFYVEKDSAHLRKLLLSIHPHSGCFSFLLKCWHPLSLIAICHLSQWES